jgi:hypothetical protein
MTPRGPLTLLVLALTLALPAGGDARSAQTVGGYGIAAALPDGWDGRVVRGTLIASTTPLPPVRGWINTELSRTLRRGDLGLLLHEFEPPPGRRHRGPYRRGAPRPFLAKEFEGFGRQRIARRNFVVAGRFFDLFVESRGERLPTSEALAGLNRLVGSLEIERGDHYPGIVGSPRFRQAPGWSMRSSRTVDVGPTTVAYTVAASVAYRDGLADLPPGRTLGALPPEGIVIRVALVADNRHTPIAAPREPLASGPPFRLRQARCMDFEGFPETRGSCVLRSILPRRYRVEIWVFYGRKQPAAEQRARAQAQLDRLTLPVWPLWR